MKNHIKNAANANATTLRDLPAVRKLAEEQAHEVYERMVVVHGAPDLDVFLDLLFIPAPEHRDALLGDGVGGARMPVAMRLGERWAPADDDPADAWALILIWRGKIAQEGCDRLARVLNAHGSRWSFDLRCDYGGSVDGHSMGLAALAERAGLGTVVRVGGDRG